MMRRAQPWLGTLVDICLDQADDADAMAAAFACFALVQRLMSFHDPHSDVSRFNRALPGEMVTLDQHTWNVLQLAREVASRSDGCFNIACAPRLVAWDYLPAPAGAVPDFIPGIETYVLEMPGQVRKSAPAWLDLGGIAKGYAVDLAMETLAARGVTSACVNAGGDLRVAGPREWPVALRSPAQPTVAARHIGLCNAALATSGSYFSAKALGAARVSALVDTRDGSALAGRTSVSVQAPTCALADALTKVVMASGDAGHPCLASFHSSAFII